MRVLLGIALGLAGTLSIGMIAGPYSREGMVWLGVGFVLVWFSGFLVHAGAWSRNGAVLPPERAVGELTGSGQRDGKAKQPEDGTDDLRVCDHRLYGVRCDQPRGHDGWHEGRDAIGYYRWSQDYAMLEYFPATEREVAP